MHVSLPLSLSVCGNCLQFKAVLKDHVKYHLSKQAIDNIKSQQRTAAAISDAWVKHLEGEPEAAKIITLNDGYWIIDFGEEFQMAVKVVDFTRILNQRTLGFSDLAAGVAGKERINPQSPLRRGVRQQIRRLHRRTDGRPEPADYNSNEEDEIKKRGRDYRKRVCAPLPPSEERALPTADIQDIDDGLDGVFL